MPKSSPLRCVRQGTEKPGVGYTRKRGGILCPNFFDRLMQRARICFPVQIDLSSDSEDLGIVRFDGRCAIKNCNRLGITAQIRITERDLLQRIKIARIDLKRALDVLQGLFAFTLPAQDVACELEHSGIVWQSASGHFELRQGSIIIEIPAIK